MKRKQTRYTTEEQIIEVIDRKKAEAKRCLEWAVACDAEVEKAYKSIAELSLQMQSARGDKWQKMDEQCRLLKHEADLNKQQAVRCSKRRNRIEGTTLPKLKDCLAEFRTKLMAYTEDPGVVLK